MAERRTSQPPYEVRAEDDQVVVKVTRRQAEAMATSIVSSGAARHDESLIDLAHSLATAAQPHRDSPTLSRGAFLRGHWGAAKTPAEATAHTGLAVSDEAHAVGPVEAAPPAPPEGASRRLQDMDPTQIAEHLSRATGATLAASAAQIAAAQATQAAAVVSLRADSAAAQGSQTSHLTDESLEALELAEENALSAAAVARAVAAAAVQAAATATAAAEAFEVELAKAAEVLAALPKQPAHEGAQAAPVREHAHAMARAPEPTDEQ
jgi:hypothetical protein